MEKVWIILESDGYENRIVGACSSKEKAYLTVAAMKHIGHYTDLLVEEHELDRIFSDATTELTHILKDYEKANELLEKMRKES